MTIPDCALRWLASCIRTAKAWRLARVSKAIQGLRCAQLPTRGGWAWAVGAMSDQMT